MKKTALLIFIVTTVFFFKANSQANSSYASNIGKGSYGASGVKTLTELNTPILIDDFESEISFYKKWSNPMESGTMKSSIDLSDTAYAGKKGAKISFVGTKSKGSWTNLQCKTTVPVDKNKIVFWAKAEKECTIKITMYQGGVAHTEMEIFGKTIIIGKSWKKYDIGISEFTEAVFSHPQQDGGKASETVYKEKVIAIGFAEVNSQAIFYLDNLMIE